MPLFERKKMGIVIAIDGPAGAGKSSTAKAVARRLGFTYIDTGAMYRAVTYLVIRNGIDVKDEAQVIALARTAQITFKWHNDELLTILNGEDVSREIRSAAVANLVSPVSAIGGVREIMVQLQRDLGREHNVVMEGRDIGTRVFPEAEFKIYLDANVETRARRRIKDYQRIGQNLTLDEIIAEIKKRDEIDSTRQHSPLMRAADAIVIDTSDLTFEEQVERIIDLVRAKYPQLGA